MKLVRNEKVAEREAAGVAVDTAAEVVAGAAEVMAAVVVADAEAGAVVVAEVVAGTAAATADEIAEISSNQIRSLSGLDQILGEGVLNIGTPFSFSFFHKRSRAIGFTRKGLGCISVFVRIVRKESHTTCFLLGKCA
jgi:hypothetical protein